MARLQGFDYSSVGAYFITICTMDRRCILSRIVGAPVPTRANSAFSKFLSAFKRFYNKEYGENIWARANDHIIRNGEDYEEHIRYICENPLRWQFDKLYVQ